MTWIDLAFDEQKAPLLFEQYVVKCAEHAIPQSLAKPDYEMRTQLVAQEMVKTGSNDPVTTYDSMVEYWNRPIDVQALSESRGLGDTVAKILHKTGLDNLAHQYTKVTGKPCGCAERQAWLNKKVPYAK